MKQQIEHMRIEPGEMKGGKFSGATVEHRMKPMPSHSSKDGMGMAYHEPERHIFGKDDGHAMLAHIANHMGIAEQERDSVDNKDGVSKDGEYN